MRRPSGFGWLAVAHVGVAIVGWVALRATTELLTTSDYGYLVLALALLQLARGALTGPVLTAQVRFKPRARLESDAGAFDAAMLRIALGAVLGAAGIAAIGAIITGIFGRESALLLLAVLAGWCLADALRSLPLNELNVVEAHRGYAILRVASAVTLPVAGIAACLIVERTWIVFLSGSVLGGLAFGVGSIMLVVTEGLFRPSGGQQGESVRQWAARIRDFALPLIPLAATSWVIHLVDRFLLETFHDASSVGRYAALYSLASQPFIMLSSVATLFFRPRLFDAQETSKAETGHVYRRWFGFVIVSGVMGLIALWLLRNPLTSVLVAQEYRRDTWLVGPVAAGYLFLALAQVEENCLFSQMDSRRVLIGGVVATIATVGTGLALIPAWGVAGAAWSTFMALGIYWAAMMFLARYQR